MIQTFNQQLQWFQSTFPPTMQRKPLIERFNRRWTKPTEISTLSFAMTVRQMVQENILTRCTAITLRFTSSISQTGGLVRQVIHVFMQLGACTSSNSTVMMSCFRMPSPPYCQKYRRTPKSVVFTEGTTSGINKKIHWKKLGITLISPETECSTV